MKFDYASLLTALKDPIFNLANIGHYLKTENANVMADNANALLLIYKTTMNVR
ncbi:hypothetical protein [Sodalis endosymbiont of Henestaris halophilus]|uniref:hypothetical protein n=1 Tax=Sodalis endosymbiont of Henestaris halophilus TaxID=1929246 RepID=UPI0012FD1632|nr:hypothetical protein [Sodalis endosymbiont of Henestaris halophilus]